MILECSILLQVEQIFIYLFCRPAALLRVSCYKAIVRQVYIYIYIYIKHICIGYHMRGEVISVLSLERRYHILSRVSAANEGQSMIS